jgi:hypothetical protein
MTRRIPALVLAAISLLAVISRPGRTADKSADPLVDQVRDAIKEGLKWLRSQEKNGSWDNDFEGQGLRPGGWTSLALLALLNAGVPADDEVIQRGLVYLRTIEPSQTYVVGLQTMVFAQAGQSVDQLRIQRNLDWLVAARGPNGWSYTKVTDREGRLADNSNSQYALLGLHDGLLARQAVDPKVTIDARVFKEIRDFYISKQMQGGWGYRADMAPTTTMTTAGVCALLITGLDLAQGKQQLRADGSAENCGVYEENRPVADGLAWLGARFPAKLTPNSFAAWGAPYYCLYGIERAGRLTGQRYLGGHDWYRIGCEYLVKTQKAEGYWEGGAGRNLDSQPLVATSFALLFLSKGRTPILLTKMAHGDGDGWNNKRSDCRYLAEFASRELFKRQPMAWQVFDIRRKEAADEEALHLLASELLPSPIVYINGHHLRLSDKEKTVLTEYINNGGFLLAEACCGDRENFDRDFRKLMDEMFPDNKLQRVPPDHPVWYASGKFAVNPNDFSLYGIQQGCKWVVLYSDKPLAGYWEANQYKDGRGKAAFQLGANIIAYATGLQAPQPRLTEANVIRDDMSASRVRRGYLEVGQLAHGGDWKPAPRAMRFLMEELRKSGVDVLLSTAQVRLSPDLQLEAQPNAPIRHIADVFFFYLHGRREFTAGKKELEALRFRLENGGTLLADACCGSKTFDASFRKFMDQLWEGKLKLEPIPPKDEVYSAELNGAPIQVVRCRREGPDGKRASPEYQLVPPALEGVKFNGRWVVIYSRYDLGCALEKRPTSDCLGHDYASAVLLGKAAVLYALKR